MMCSEHATLEPRLEDGKHTVDVLPFTDAIHEHHSGDVCE
jgi:hypothetical protein